MVRIVCLWPHMCASDIPARQVSLHIIPFEDTLAYNLSIATDYVLGDVQNPSQDPPSAPAQYRKTRVRSDLRLISKFGPVSHLLTGSESRNESFTHRDRSTGTGYDIFPRDEPFYRRLRRRSEAVHKTRTSRPVGMWCGWVEGGGGISTRSELRSEGSPAQLGHRVDRES